MSFHDWLIYAMLIGSIVLFGGAAILALSFGVRTGQFSNFQRASRSIFDPDEPIGQVTDRFPGQRPAPHEGSNVPH